MANMLTGVHEELDEHIRNLGYFGEHLGLTGLIPANGGDISILLGEEAAEAVLRGFKPQSELILFRRLSELVHIRRDGRTHYNAESVPEEITQDLIRPLAGRVVVITATGAKLWDIARHPERRLCVLEVNPDGRGFHLLYGNREYGLIPSIETLSHLVALATTLKEGAGSASAFHAHPPALVAVDAHMSVRGSYEELNKILFSQKEGVLTNLSDLVGVVPYEPSGSKALLEKSIESIQQHRFTLWERHGVFIRERSFERCIDLLEYAEDAAKAALRALLNPEAFLGLTRQDVERAVQLYNINPRILDLLG
ncbi:MAG: Uncharacterized protein Greene041639_497 [Parcubacteria group bacterium Greene0416_39]|nr:MAG: Uncharacterized protein Greene041639_497 [Parcubacteria group bacterium Greene0416_39]TSC97638.1 MAG: Uncharacterized protein Greene101447_385 [Parcubacteria group bacterium Greene1014_47]